MGVEAALQNLPNLSRITKNVTVSGPIGGPFIVTFEGLLNGSDVPLIKTSATSGLSVNVATIVEATSVPVFRVKNGKVSEVKFGSLLGRNDIMYGGTLDLDGNSTFQAGMSLETLKMGLKVGFS